MFVQRYPYHPLLGRTMALDPRSLDHAIERESTRSAIKPVTHAISIPILDQSNLVAQGIRTSQLVPGAPDVDGLGSCTCQSGTYAMAASPALAERVVKASGRLDETYAIRLYPDVTRADEFTDEQWPPVDCGSSGLGVCRVLKRRGLIGSYAWATTVEGLGALLQRGTAMFGMPWYNAFFEPDARGFIDAVGVDQALASGLAGGHEVCVIALETWHEGDPGNSVVAFPNSWGGSWGDHGYGRMRLSTYAALRRQIDIKQIRV